MGATSGSIICLALTKKNGGKIRGYNFRERGENEEKKKHSINTIPKCKKGSTYEHQLVVREMQSIAINVLLL